MRHTAAPSSTTHLRGKITRGMFLCQPDQYSRRDGGPASLPESPPLLSSIEDAMLYSSYATTTAHSSSRSSSSEAVELKQALCRSGVTARCALNIQHPLDTHILLFQPGLCSYSQCP